MSKLDWLTQEIEGLKEQGLYNRIRTIGSAQGARIVVDGKDVLNFCSNNYLGLANHPRLVEAAKEATNTIPIVMAQDIDPVGSGFVASLSRPGGNITGLSSLSADISGKRLELLREVVPAVYHVAVLGTSTVPGTTGALQEIGRAAGLLGMKLQFHDVVSPKHIDSELGALVAERAEAVLVLQSLVLNSHRKRIVDHTVKNRLPAMYYAPEWVEDGGLMTYGVSFIDLYRRAATYVDKILKGTKPADLPVEQPMKFELIINLKTAKQMGLTIPVHVLAQADRVIR